MNSGPSPKKVKSAFEPQSVRIAISDIVPLKIVSPQLKASKKYTQIAASIKEVGIVEPPSWRQTDRRRGNICFSMAIFGSRS